MPQFSLGESKVADLVGQTGCPHSGAASTY